MIASVAFRNFKALRNARVALTPFNLVIGANGSGKSSLIEALLRLRTLARLPLGSPPEQGERREGMPEVTFRFLPPFDGWEAAMSCVSEDRCDLLQIQPTPSGAEKSEWPSLREKLLAIRSYEFNHQVIGRPSPLSDGDELASDASNLASFLALRQRANPDVFDAWRVNVLEALPEYDDVSVEGIAGGTPHLGMRLRNERRVIPHYDLSQGTLYTLAILALGHEPKPPTVVCIEELDRGLHPRLLRQARDALYRLSHPEASGLKRAGVQVIATTHSPYLLDLFRDHPEEVVIADKQGQTAHFLRLSDRPDLPELMAGVSLGDLWYTGILGGVPEDSS